jgi:alpha-1,3-mannosyltransferase
MNVLHISRQFYPCIGGIETYIYEVSKRLLGEGINCRVVALDCDLFDKKGKLNKFEKLDGIEIFRVRGIRYPKKPIPLESLIHLFKWADVVHIHDLRFLYERALLLKQLYKYKIILSTHGFLFHTAKLKLIKAIIMSLCYRPTVVNFVDTTICSSKQDFEYLQAWNLRNVHLIENGIDFNKFNNIARSPIQGRLLYFGKIDIESKGLDLLLQSLALIKDCGWRLDIVGGGFNTEIESLKYMARRLNVSLKITWHGFLPEDQLFNLLSTSHICLFPSRYEGFGNALVEALAAGCVCVANAISVHKDKIDNEKNGFLVDFSSPRETKDTIKHLLNMPQESLSGISQNAKHSAKNYDWAGKIGQIKDIYRKVLAD